MGSERNSLRSDNVHFLIHFLSCTNGSVRAGYFHRFFESLTQFEATKLLLLSLFLKFRM